jgi:hypothetical protein
MSLIILGEGVDPPIPVTTEPIAEAIEGENV